MYAGNLTYKLLLRSPEVVASSYGGFATVYEDSATVWAERVRQSGGRSEEVGEHFADYTVEWNIRWAHTVSEGWQVRDEETGYLYTVVSITPNRRRGYRTLKCARVNE